MDNSQALLIWTGLFAGGVLIVAAVKGTSPLSIASSYLSSPQQGAKALPNDRKGLSNDPDTKNVVIGNVRQNGSTAGKLV